MRRRSDWDSGDFLQGHGFGCAFFLVILRSAFFVDQRTYGVVGNLGAPRRVRRSFSAK